MDNIKFAHLPKTRGYMMMALAKSQRDKLESFKMLQRATKEKVKQISEDNDEDYFPSSSPKRKRTKYKNNMDNPAVELVPNDAIDPLEVEQVQADAANLQIEEQVQADDVDLQVEEQVQDDALGPTQPQPGLEIPDRGTTKKGLPRKRKARQEMSPGKKRRLQTALMREKHPLIPPCANCRNKCTSIISEEQRSNIHTQFWSMSWSDQRSFIFNNVSRTSVKRLTTGEISSRVNSQTYYLKTDNLDKVCVCKTFFLTTLGYTKENNTVIKNVMKSASLGVLCPKPDKRGHHNNHSKVDRNVIEAHIMSFNPSVSHYRREHAPNRRYLPFELTIKDMHVDFLTKHAGITCSYELYRSVLAKMNISFAKLGHEECEQCGSFGQHNETHTKEHLVPDCGTCQQWKVHIDRAKNARTKYQEDVNSFLEDPSQAIYSADLQKVIMLPHMDTYKSVVFTKRIIVLNESFVPLGKSKQGHKPFAVIWHEGIAGRKKEDIISAFHAFFLKHRDAEHITLWLDNCSAQNKNWTLFSYFVFIANSNLIAMQTLEVNYFEPGHTFMSADSFHHEVEQSMRRKGKQYDFSDFKTAVDDANSSNVFTKEMKPNDFFDWKDQSSLYKINKQQPRPYLNEMVQVTATKGLKILHYRNNFNEPLKKELNFLSAKHMKNNEQLPEPRKNARGVQQEKKDDIIKKLCPLMPINRRKFWEELEVNQQVLDLVDHVDD